jgi:hypothetical protein
MLTERVALTADNCVGTVAEGNEEGAAHVAGRIVAAAKGRGWGLRGFSALLGLFRTRGPDPSGRAAFSRVDRTIASRAKGEADGKHGVLQLRFSGTGQSATGDWARLREA